MKDSYKKTGASEAKSDLTESTFDVVPESAQQQQDTVIAEFMANRPTSPVAPSLPKRPKREDFETDDDFEEALGFYHHRMPRRYKVSPAQ
jgi:hypothetical protein